MAKSQVRVNAEEFVKSLDKVKMEYHLELINVMTRIMDNVRRIAANNFIIPRKVPWSYAKWRAYKLQPTHPKFLTERTGTLRRTLLAKGTWNIQPRIAKLKSDPHLNFWVQPNTRSGSTIYIGRGSFVTAGDRKDLFGANGVYYKHETGRWGNMPARPFLLPAVQANKQFGEFELKSIVNEKRVI